MNRRSPKDFPYLEAIALFLVLGCIWLAVIDPSSRGGFFQIVNLFIGGLLGATLPSNTSSSSTSTRVKE